MKNKEGAEQPDIESFPSFRKCILWVFETELFGYNDLIVNVGMFWKVK